MTRFRSPWALDRTISARKLIGGAVLEAGGLAALLFLAPPPASSAPPTEVVASTSVSTISDPSYSVAGIPAAEIARFSDQFFTSQLQITGTPGALVEVVDAAGHRWEKGYGTTDVAKTTVPDPVHTYFRIASETKFFTALGILVLVERGRISLDDDAERWLGGIHLVPWMSQPITIRDLLQHTAGVSNIPMVGAALDRVDKHIPLSEYLGKSAPLRLRPPGEVIAYSNGAYTLLGRIIETASAQTYEQFIHDTVLTYLGMSKATFTLDETVRRDLMIGAELIDKQPKSLIVVDTQTHPSGDLITTPHEMGNFMLMMLNEGSYDRRVVLRPETLHSIYTDCFATSAFQTGACLGLGRSFRKGFIVYSHGGDYVTYKSTWWVVPSLGLGIWAGNNSDSSMSSRYFDAFSRRFLPGAADLEYPSRAVPESGKYAGYYRSNSSGMARSARFFDIFPTDNDIRVQMSTNGGLQIGEDAYRPIGDQSFQEIQPQPGSDIRSVVTFSDSAASLGRYMQSGESSSTQLPWYLRASINRCFAFGCTILLPFLAIATALLAFPQRRIPVRLISSAIGLATAASALLIFTITSAGVNILWGFSPWFRAGQALLWLEGALSAVLLVLCIFESRSRSWSWYGASATAILGTLLFAWARYWDFA